MKYLDHVKARHSAKTYAEKHRAFRYLAKYTGEIAVEQIDAHAAIEFLDQLHEERSGSVANRARKNLGAAWEWGLRFIRGFPQVSNPFLAVDKYPEDSTGRYVPPAEHFWRVYETAEGQDRVMLAAMFYLAARRGEIFRLTWADVDFDGGKVRLTTRKTRGASLREDWLPMVPELREALTWWKRHRPCVAENVFMITDDTPHEYHVPGMPYTSRAKFMRRLCKRANVFPTFGFHAIRHLRAVTLYKQGARLHVIQKWLRHESASTTERYLKGCGVDLDLLLEAAMSSDTGQAGRQHYAFGG
ncbi:MAG: site-specific integrase [Desulfovibrio sp.]|nr:site-specific integrase [Desulfovibrio sp.]